MIAETERKSLIEQLEARNLELKRLLYAFVHDFNGRLAIIGASVDLIERAVADGSLELLECDLAQIGNAARTLRLLLDELLTLCEAGCPIDSPQQLLLGDLARQAVEKLAEQIARRAVRVEIAPDLPTVAGDRARLLLVLERLLDNAVKFSGDQLERRVEIGVRQDGEKTVCYVRDNGMGIDPRYHQKAFELFDKFDRHSQGVGLGLALIKRIVEVHGGRVWIESCGPGTGSTICFTIKTTEEKQP